MGESIFSHRHAADEACPSCGTPVKHGVTTQYIDELDAEICAVCEQPLSSAESRQLGVGDELEDAGILK